MQEERVWYIMAIALVIVVVIGLYETIAGARDWDDNNWR